MATNRIQAKAFLANLPLFKELSAEELDRVAAATRQVHAERGQVLFHRGDPASGFYVVVFGQVKLAFVGSSGAEKVVDIVAPGGSFGEAVMFMEQPHVVTAQALADTLLLHVAKDAVFAEVERDPRFARRMIGGMARRMRQLVADLESYSMRSGTERVIGFLLSSCGEAAPGATTLTVTLPAAKGVIASRLNLTQEHFSRILHDLSAAGLIEVHGREVRILDCQRLRAPEG
ncbi:MAG: Crp/Fnr family transcriptional regulator [Burkholderiales bacterium]|nr:Crp/Fnr family transcriptional regulator [Burkholderiales bacterium]